MGEDFGKMLEAVINHDMLCDVCRFRRYGCGGLTPGPNGPIYPPCADGDPENYVDEDSLQEIYREIMEGE